MSFSNWFKGLMGSHDPDDPDAIPDMEYDEPFVFSQHLRIVLAIVVTIIGACVVWWILV